MIILYSDYPDGYAFMEEFFPILDTPADCKHPVEDEDDEDEDNSI